MRDFYPGEIAARNAIFEAWTAAARCFGFAQYDACVVESLDLLKRKGGEEIVEQIYAFQDKSGRDLALRPEMTPTLARMITARQGALNFPIKWFAIAQCFRYERMSRGRKREHYQWNLDIVGAEALMAEAEILACALCALGRLGLAKQDVIVHINNRALLAEFLAQAGIAPAAHAATFLALDKRGKLDDAGIAQSLKSAGLGPGAIDAVFRMTGIRSLDEAAAVLGAETPALQAVRSLFDLLARYGIGDQVCFDIGVVRGLGYYTGIVFEAFDAEKKLRAIFGGGRYDRLLEDLGGGPIPAVGLGFGDVVIAELLAEKGQPAGTGRVEGEYAVGYMEDAQRAAAIDVAQSLRRSGANTDLALHSERAKRFFARVGKSGFKKAVFIGPDDIAGGKARVKDLETRAETELAL